MIGGSKERSTVTGWFWARAQLGIIVAEVMDVRRRWV
jgi:hypothetical protein